VREDLEADEVEPGNLTHEDYHWEITDGDDPADDLAGIEWNQDLGSSIRFADLQSFLVVFLPALRDVEADPRQFHNSPLARLIAAMEIDPTEQEQLLDALRKANAQIARANHWGAIANAVDASFKSVAGPAFSMNVALGLGRTFISGHRARHAHPPDEHSDDELRSVLERPSLNNILYGESQQLSRSFPSHTRVRGTATRCAQFPA
jgi:predicted ATP-dependent endonuclease of OLD family